MKKTQLMAIEEYMKEHGSVAPSRLSLDVCGVRMSYGSFERRLRELDNVEKTKNSKGHVTYHWRGSEDKTPEIEPTKEELNSLPQLAI